MRADDQAGAAVAEMTHRHLLAGRFRMNIDYDGIGAFAQRTGRKLRFGRGKRIVQSIHEDAPH